VELVVQGRLLHGGARDRGRLHDPEGGDAPGAAHLHLDVQQLRGDLLRRELHRGRPAGGTGGGAQRPLLREGIDLRSEERRGGEECGAWGWPEVMKTTYHYIFLILVELLSSNRASSATK